MIRATILALAALLAPPAMAAESITFTTDFGFNGRHAYYFLAQERGYYREAGLEVEFVRGRGSADALKQVAAGRATLGFADTGSLVLARGNDGLPVRLVAIVYRKPPHAIYARKDLGIATVKDLEGKRIGDAAGSANTAMFPAYAKAAGLDASKVTWVVADSAALPSMLAAGTVPAVGQFVIGEPLLRKQLGDKELVRLAYADGGLDFYSNGIVATEETIEKKPALVKAFVAATLKGLRAAVADPAAAAAALTKAQPQVDPEIGAAETKIVAELAGPVERLGVIDPAAVARTVSLVKEAFALSRPVDPAEVFAPGFVAN